MIQRDRGQFQQADEHFALALAAVEKRFGPDHPTYAELSIEFAKSLVAQGRSEEALKRLETALSIQEKRLREDHPKIALTKEEIAKIGKTR